MRNGPLSSSEDAGSLISSSINNLFKRTPEGHVFDSQRHLEPHPGLNTDVRAFIHSKTKAPNFKFDADEDYDFSQSYEEIEKSRRNIKYLPRDPRFMSEYRSLENSFRNHFLRHHSLRKVKMPKAEINSEVRKSIRS